MVMVRWPLLWLVVRRGGFGFELLGCPYLELKECESEMEEGG